MAKATASNIARFRKLSDLGCYCCAKMGWYAPPDIHHILSGGRRKGHDATIPLCAWHHRGHCEMGWNKARMRLRFGPSLADGSKPFHAHWGTQLEILDEINATITGVPNGRQTVTPTVKQANEMPASVDIQP